MKLQCIAVYLVAVFLGACQPSGPAPDLVKTQRETLDKAKGVEQQLQQQAQERMQSAKETD